MIGYGNSMFLATHGILAKSASGGGVDPDAQAFITAAAITDPTQQSAINQLVVDLKGYSIWTKMKALYPFVGGTAAQHKWNLKNPLDTNAAFRIFWSGGVTHSANGVQFGGVNGFGDTFLTPSTSLTASSGHLSVYSRTNIAEDKYEIGANFSSIDNMIATRWSTNLFYVNYGNSTYPNISNTDSRGHFITNRNSGTNTTGFKNGVNIINAAQTGNIASVKLYLGALNLNNVDIAYSSKELAFASIGDGLTDTEAANYYTAVQAFQTTLGRSIGTQTVSDADAQAFVNAANITDQVEANAINNLVIGLKADGLWTKMQAIYPFVGGTASQHTWNLRNTAQYQANWIGGVTHSNLGVKFNGMNGYGGTGLNFSTALASSNSNSIGYYSGTNLSETMPDPISMGAYDNVANFALIAKNNTSFFARLNAASVSHSTITMKGFFSASRQSSTLTDIYLNGSQVATGNSGGVLPNFTCYLGNINIANAPYGSGYILNDMRFAYISDGLNDTEMTNLYNRVQTFQTTLGRQV